MKRITKLYAFFPVIGDEISFTKYRKFFCGEISILRRIDISIHRTFVAVHGIFVAVHRIFAADHGTFVAVHKVFVAVHGTFVAVHRIFAADHGTFAADHRIFVADHEIFESNIFNNNNKKNLISYE